MPRHPNVKLQSDVIDEMLVVADGSYLKYELEDAYVIFKQAILNMLQRGDEIDLDGLISFRHRYWKNNDPLWLASRDNCRSTSCTLKVSISPSLKKKFKEWVVDLQQNEEEVE